MDGSASRLECLGRRQRLLSKAQFDKLFRSGRRDPGPFFLVIVLPNDLPHARLGLAVSRRVASRAVERNRIKRLIRESFRLHQSQLAGHDLVVVARPYAAGTDNSRLSVSLARHWSNVCSVNA